MRKRLWAMGVLLIWHHAALGQIVFPGSTLPFQLPGLDLNFTGGGARSRGMGGAFSAVDADLSAVGFNPAGFATLDRPQTSLVYRYNRPGVRTLQLRPGGGIDIDYWNIDSFDQIDFGAVAAPGKFLGHTFVGMASYTVFADQFHADQKTFSIVIDTNNNTANSVWGRQASGELAGFNLGVATRFNRFSFGATFQIYQGGFSDTTNVVIGPFTVNRGQGNEPALRRQRLANKTDYRGSSLILGMQADYQNARLGVSARIPSFKLGDTDLFRLKSKMDIGFYDTLLVSGFPDASVLPGLLFFTDSRLELPLSLSAGLSYTFGKSLLVDFDYTYTNWGAADLKVRRRFEAPFSNPATIELGRAPVNLTSTHQIRLGWEYGFNPGFGQLFVRGGVRNLPVRTLTSLLPFFYEVGFNDSIVVDAQGNQDTISSTAQLIYGASEDNAAKGFGASAGLGLRWNQVALDVAYDYSTYLRTSRFQSLQGELVTFHRQRQHRIFIGFTGYFTRL